MLSSESKRKRKPEKVSQADKAVLRDLLRIGAATPTKFEVKTNRIGTDIEDALNRLYERHLIGKKPDSNVFYPTAKTLWKSYV
ncbi:hypothetical protein PCC8801_3916 [Rippkaea orientalis PCC 8801]|uniref:Uncharacterized protein n=1 Tax=Rippkaea orientalis (strain PCC 8801 / RF-1) TaxID=41431 RepID=B7K536_RIPO1|nr:hypothetical protein [Rippkaea orientalis]ACK67862.1 hypothetical protein PCC8801_3916 [Rippkaea orientalis PCC 8801]